jgi:hypothetical protein
MGLLDRLLKKRKPRARRVNVRLAVRIAGSEQTFYTLDLASGGARIGIGRQASLADVTGGSRDVRIRILLEPGQPEVEVVGEPVWTVRGEDGELSTGWMFTRYEGDGHERLKAFVDSVG